jgi:hypothetical protein
MVDETATTVESARAAIVVPRLVARGWQTDRPQDEDRFRDAIGETSKEYGRIGLE